MESSHDTFRTIYLGGGCFWCTEAVFQKVRGVQSVVPGYMGGSVPNPSYEAVCTGATGHAEVVQVIYDTGVIPTSALLDIFFATHDSTTPDRQGADQGSQYRSIIFYTDEAMRQSALEAVARTQENVAGRAVVTHVVEAPEFYPAEEYHYSYYANNTDAPYCVVTIDPKLQKLLQKFANHVK